MHIIITVLLFVLPVPSSFASDFVSEYVTTTPLLVDGHLYVASTEQGRLRGHLRAIEINDSMPHTLWDAADLIPPAGRVIQQSREINPDNQSRTIFTNRSTQLVPFEANSAPQLMSAMDLSDLSETELLIQAVRGRRGVSNEMPEGSYEDTERLWNLNRSSPAMVERCIYNPLAEQRSRVLFVGAGDGMLHAIHVSYWDEENGDYPIEDDYSGIELWAYLPESFLSSMKDQPLDVKTSNEVVHLDGTPVIKEFFIDLDGDGTRQWHTLLIASGTLTEKYKSCLFVMDITNPALPALIWEQLLPGDSTGRTRGIIVGACDDNQKTCIYLTTDFSPETHIKGISALSIELVSGELLWQFSTPYRAGPATSETPGLPVLASLEDRINHDVLLLGDLNGRLWALDLVNGHALGGEPVFTTPGHVVEPIGAGVAVHNQTAYFGTGGVPGLDEQYEYGLYAIELSRSQNSLKWHSTLERGEQVWGTPHVDEAGNVVFATARNYEPLLPVVDRSTSGRLIALDKNGNELLTRETGAAAVGRVAIANEVVTSVSLTGETTQIGFAAPSDIFFTENPLGAIQVFSWRYR